MTVLGTFRSLWAYSNKDKVMRLRSAHMGMPQIPEGKNRPSFNETMIDLLESIALEEMALSHIMNAEGEKLQELIRKFYCSEINICELEYSCKNMQGMINSLIMKEWLLMNKLGTIMEVNHQFGEQKGQESGRNGIPSYNKGVNRCVQNRAPCARAPYPPSYDRSQPLGHPPNQGQCLGQYPINYVPCSCQSTRCDIEC